MTIQLLEKFSNWPIVWDGIWYGKDTFEPETSRIVARQNGSAIRSGSAGMLDVIESLGIGLPDIDFYLTYGFPFHVFDCANYEKWLSVRISRYETAMSAMLGFVCMEGSKDCAFSAILRLRVIDRINQ